MQRQAGVPRRASRTEEPVTDEEEIPDSHYTTRLPTSARRYYDTRGNQVIQRGNRRIIIHEEPPPRGRGQFHWLLWVGMVMLLAISVAWLVNAVGTWWVNEQNTWSYGMPRTYQTDAVVGHGDSWLHPSHFIALNLNGRVEVIEIPADDPTREKVYVGPVLFSANPELVPVTVSFEDVNGDGKPDMLIHIQGQTIIFLNNGKQFVPST